MKRRAIRFHPAAPKTSALLFIRTLTLSLFLWIPLAAYAVDGVGLLEFFPGFGILVRLLFFSAAVTVLVMGFSTDEKKPPSKLRRVLAVAVAVPLLYPVAQPVISNFYLDSLCRNEAAVQIALRSEDWSPSVPKAPLRFQARWHANEWEENVAPDLLEYRRIEGDHAFGVQSISYRLPDERTGKILLFASYFSNHSKGPMSCEAATTYWRLRTQFARKAWAIAER
jgi:hypothetical protein